ncbi:hypothetical protein ACHAWO_007499 [Cyclotella atomus]|uniref:Uncharacterized protein n=1 Tax=Cyclotella atomus TaxID=382360 RepID=A0ABD3P1Q9_9STRA
MVWLFLDTPTSASCDLIMTLRYSYFSITGRITHLSENDLRQFLTGSFGEEEMKSYITRGAHLNSHVALFTPTSVGIGCRALECLFNRLRLTDSKRELDNSSDSNDNEFRQKMIEAFGDDNDKSQLEHNNDLKRQFCDILHIHCWASEVSLSHHGQTFFSKLSNERRATLDIDGVQKHMWCISVNNATTNDDITTLSSEISGVCINLIYPPPVRVVSLIDVVTVDAYFTEQVIVRGSLPLSGLNETQVHENIERAFGFDEDEDGFYLLSVNPTEVIIEMVKIKETLTLLGINCEINDVSTASKTIEESMAELGISF